MVRLWMLSLKFQCFCCVVRQWWIIRKPPETGCDGFQQVFGRFSDFFIDIYIFVNFFINKKSRNPPETSFRRFPVGFRIMHHWRTTPYSNRIKGLITCFIFTSDVIKKGHEHVILCFFLSVDFEIFLVTDPILSTLIFSFFKLEKERK